MYTLQAPTAEEMKVGAKEALADGLLQLRKGFCPDLIVSLREALFGAFAGSLSMFAKQPQGTALTLLYVGFEAKHVNAAYAT